MLTELQQREEIKKLQRPDWLEDRRKRAKSLKGKTAEVARGLLGEHDPNAIVEYDDDAWDEFDFLDRKKSPAKQAKRKALAAMAKMPRSEIAAVVGVLYPKLADDIMAGWDLIADLPFQDAGWSKAFRAPGNDRLAEDNRQSYLRGLLVPLEHYEADLEFMFAHGTLVGHWSFPVHFAVMLAGIIARGGKRADDVLARLIKIAGEGAASAEYGGWVYRALLCSPRPEAWEFVANVLKTAQREEGLRQAVLESADVGQKGAFIRILRTLEEEDMGRFASVVRAVDVWAGLLWDSAATLKVTATIATMRRLVENADERKAAIEGDDAEKVYFGLWASACDDAPGTIEPARKLLSHPSPAHRWVGVHLLSQLGMDEALEAIAPALADADLRVASRALDSVPNHSRYGVAKERGKLDVVQYGLLKQTLENVRKGKASGKPLVWPWVKHEVKAEQVVARMTYTASDEQLVEVWGYRELMSADNRSEIARRLGKIQNWPGEMRAMGISLLLDVASSVRSAIGEAFAKAKLQVSEVEAKEIEAVLDRKSADLRRTALQLLSGQPDKAAIASARRLMGEKNAGRRTAGLVLLIQLAEEGREKPAVAEAFKTYQNGRKAPVSDEVEKRLIARLEELQSGTSADSATLDDCLGLMKGRALSPVVQPQKREFKYLSKAADTLLMELDKLVDEHRDDEVRQVGYDGAVGESRTLGAIGWAFPRYRLESRNDEAPTALPMEGLWRKFWLERKIRDDDGLEFMRILFRLALGDIDPADRVERKAAEIIRGSEKAVVLKYREVVSSLVSWLPTLEAVPAKTGLEMMTGIENLVASMPPAEKLQKDEDHYGRLARTGWSEVHDVVEKLWSQLPSEAKQSGIGKMWQILRWHDQPEPDFPRDRADWSVVSEAFSLGHATEGDLIDCLIGQRASEEWSNAFYPLTHATVSGDEGSRWSRLRGHPKSDAILQLVVQRVVEVETARAEVATVATEPARALRRSGGLRTVAQALKCLGKSQLTFGGSEWARDAASRSRPAVMTHLLDTSKPAAQDTPDAFAKAVGPLGVPEKTLVGLAALNPAWAPHVEAMLKWDGLGDAVWWIYAHTRGSVRPWGDGQMIVAELAQRTPIAPADLTDGAVDVDWFWRIYKRLGAKRWEVLDESAKHASGGGSGHTRARLFADALIGNATRAELTTRITTKRFPDAVRALGLVKLKAGDAGKKDLRARFGVIQEFLRTSKQFGSQRQASEKRAAAIGMDNLARSAGYPDPIRLQWAMEAEASADLAKGPVTVKVGDVTVSLAVDEDGEVSLTATKSMAAKGKAATEKAATEKAATGKAAEVRELAAIPPAVKKDKKVAELATRKTELTRSASRMRKSLELAMGRADRFSAEELRELWGNVILRPMLARLVFVGQGVSGYPVDGGRGLRGYDGKIEPIKKGEVLHIAHPHDLLRQKKWAEWQRECLASERVQPFKQVFRELYVPTKAEAGERKSTRYAGHQVQPRQALALLGGRGWVTRGDEGIVHKTFHAEGLTAMLDFQEAFHTPAEVDGLTLASLSFMAREKGEMMLLGKIPPGLFSETMRDLDLVVSVAHRGGVDPETSESTVEMRTSLVRETAALLGLKNVHVAGKHVHIKGKLSAYTVHLGSAEAQLSPGGALPIVAVHSQHRGRVFLPFADDDPKTAEVVSKTFLLARDHEIRDPAIVEQIRARGTPQ